VIAFPKTQSGSCLLSGAPSLVADRQIKELRLRMEKPAETKNAEVQAGNDSCNSNKIFTIEQKNG
jgi:hypothetical protein